MYIYELTVTVLMKRQITVAFPIFISRKMYFI